MSRPIGIKKTGGRNAGTPNKRTLELRQLFEESGYDPISHIVDLLPELSPLDQVKTSIKILPYLYPRRKAIEASIFAQSTQCVGCIEKEAVSKLSPAEKDAEIERLFEMFQIFKGKQKTINS